MKFKLGVIFGLAGLIVMSSLGLIYNKHANRQLIAELRELQNQNDLLHIKNGQLQLEFGAWTTHQMIEQKAKNQIGMKYPEINKMFIIKSEKSHVGY